MVNAAISGVHRDCVKFSWMNVDMSLVKRSLSLSGHPTSVALEPEFWAVLERMAAAEARTVSALLRRLDETRGDRPLASAARVAALGWALGSPDGVVRDGLCPSQDDAGP